MSQTASDPAKSRSCRVPLLLSLVLLLLIAGVLVWLHFGTSDAAALAERTALCEQRLVSLRAEKARLEELLALPPCEARSRTAGVIPGGAPVAASVPAAAPLSVAVDAARLLENACVFIVTVDAAGDISTGSGFFVAPGYVVTNEHVVAGTQGRALVTSKALGQPVMANIVACDKSGDRDYALLRVATPKGASVAVPQFASAVQRTEKVGAWGFPHVIGQNDPAYKKLLNGGDLSAVPELSYSEGVVSAVLARKPPLVVHTAPISPGNSGGPLVNAKGQVVGINMMITLDEESYRQASIAIAAQDLRDFLAANGVAVTLADTR